MIDGSVGPRSLYLLAEVVFHLSTRSSTISLRCLSTTRLLRGLHNSQVSLSDAGDLRFLEELETSVLRAIESTFLTARLVTSDDVLCVFHAAAQRQPSSADQLIPAALRAFRKKHAHNIASCFTTPSESESGVPYVLDVACRLFADVAKGSVGKLKIAVAATEALNNIVKNRPDSLVEHAAQREEKLVEALCQLHSSPSEASATRDLLKHTALCWLRLATAVPDGLPRAWRSLDVLLVKHSPDVLQSSWEEDDLLHLISLLSRDDEELEGDLHAAGASFAREMLSIPADTPRTSGPPSDTPLARCLEVLNAGMNRHETRDSVKLFLKKCVPLLIDILQRGPREVKGLAVALISDLRALNDVDRRLLMSLHGAGASDGRDHIEKDSDTVREAASSGRLFSHDPTDDDPSSLGASVSQMSDVNPYEFDDVRELLGEQGNESAMEPKDILGGNNRGDDTRGGGVGSKLVRTHTTEANIETVIRLSKSAAPVLLEGGTGVGKTATIAAASLQQSPTAPLVRFNMSRTVTVDGLLGQVAMSDGNFAFVLQPFAKSFKDGNWLLLDEINLAEDAVLQCIEEAIDTRCLTLHDSSSAENPIVTIPMHQNFRLFATQNPNTGHFKGKREELSQSFTGRFISVTFRELPATEWKDVILHKLSTAAPAGGKSVLKGISDDLVDHHTEFSELIRSSEFSENRPYAAVSIRELLQVTQHLVRHLRKKTWPTEVDDIKQLIALEVWTTYGSRFRKKESRANIQRMIARRWCDLGQHLGSGGISADKAGVTVGQVTGQSGINARGVRHSFGGGLLPSRASADLVKDISTALESSSLSGHVDDDVIVQMGKLHTEFMGFLHRTDVIEEVGLYGGMSKLWHGWVEAAANDKDVVRECEDGRAESFFLIGAMTYLTHLRHRHQDPPLFDMFFKSFQAVEPSSHVSSSTFTAKVRLTLSAWSGVAKAPVAGTPRTKDVWVQLARALNAQLPILVVGDNGCGKSGAIMAIADLFGCWCTQVCLTAETDVSLLVGSQLPETNRNEEGTGPAIAWKDGLITSALTTGSWVLLDNINDADPCILERLNPLLEEDIDWRLTERGDTASLVVPSSFRVFATMTASAVSAMSRELSPALSNRFSSVFMPPVPVDHEGFLQEIRPVVRAILALPNGEEEASTAQLCWLLWAGLGPASTGQEVWRLKEGLNLRALVQFLESTYRLRSHYSMGQALVHAFQNVLTGRFRNGLEEFQAKLDEEVHTIFDEACEGDLFMPAMENLLNGSGAYHLTPRRAGYARQVCAGVMCGFPVLLEGPAATGKTALITKLAQYWQPRPQRLERVSNTQTTTIQDYLGSYVPAGGGFSFQKGALYRAMESGAWFLADEFNLADPKVMSMLSPLLEGSRTILVPDSNAAVSARDGFHFFATQNNAQDYAGRNKLPPSLRSRFMEVEVEDFETEELQEILTKRPVEIRPGVSRTVNDTAARGLALVYGQLKRCNEEQRITMRELIKWIQRRFTFHDHQGEDTAWYFSGQALLLPRAATEKSALVVASALEQVCSLSHEPGHISGGQTSDPNGARIVPTPGRRDSLMVTVGSVTREVSGCVRRCPLWHDNLPETFIKSLALMFLAVDNKEPVMLVGPTACKSVLVQTWAEITGRMKEVGKCFLSAETESSDLIGQMYPYSLTGALREIEQTSLRILQRYGAVHSQTQPGRGRASQHRSDAGVAAFGVTGVDEWSADVQEKAKRLDEAIKAYDKIVSADSNTHLQAERPDVPEVPADFTGRFTPVNLDIEDDYDVVEVSFPSPAGGGEVKPSLRDSSSSESSSSSSSSEGSTSSQDSDEDEEGDRILPLAQVTRVSWAAPASPHADSQGMSPHDASEFVTHGDDPTAPTQARASSPLRDPPARASAQAASTGDFVFSVHPTERGGAEGDATPSTGNANSTPSSARLRDIPAGSSAQAASTGDFVFSVHPAEREGEEAGAAPLEDDEHLMSSLSELRDSPAESPAKAAATGDFVFSVHEDESKDEEAGAAAANDERRDFDFGGHGDENEGGGAGAAPADGKPAVSSSSSTLPGTLPGSQTSHVVNSTEEDTASVHVNKEQGNTGTSNGTQDEDATTDDEGMSASEMMAVVREQEGRCPRQRQIQEDFGNCLSRVRELLVALGQSRAGLDAGGRQLVQRVSEMFEKLKQAKVNSSDPLFVFREGPLTKAVVASKVLFLEDFNLPNQAVTERLNSLLEPDRSFTLTEDISRPEDGKGGVGGQDTPVPPGFQVFAIVHRSHASSRLNISPATRSRFTEIAVQAYSKVEVQSILRSVVEKRLRLAPDSPESQEIVGDLIWLMQSTPTTSGVKNKGCTIDITHLLKVCDFVANATKRQSSPGEETEAQDASGLRMAALIGVRFLVLDSLDSTTAMEVVTRWNADRRITDSETLLNNLFMDPRAGVLSCPLKWANDGRIECMYGHVAAKSRLQGGDANNSARLRDKLGLQPTSTTVKNIARIFASVAAGAPLLLQVCADGGSERYSRTLFSTHLYAYGTFRLHHQASECPRSS